MAANRILFCEGGPGGLDAVVLGIICSGLGAIIRPVGGKGNLRSYIAGYTQDRLISYVAIRDRDFDREPNPQIPGLHREDSHFLVWGRHELENYFLDPPLLPRLYQRIRSWPNFAYLSHLDESALCERLERAAESILFFQAERWALGQLRPPSGWPRLTTHRSDSYQLPSDLSKEACQQALRTSLERYHRGAESLTEDKALESFEYYSARFLQSSLLSEREFLSWFSGKDLFKAFLNVLQLPQGSLKGMLHAAAQELREIPRENLPPDFEELSRAVREM